MKTTTENLIVSNYKLAAMIREVKDKHMHTSRELKSAHIRLVENIEARAKNDKIIQTNFNHCLEESKKTFDNLSQNLA